MTNKLSNKRTQELANKLDKLTDREFTELINLIEPKLLYYSWRFSRDMEVRRSMLSSTYMKLINNIDKYDYEKGRFSTWLYRIFHNVALEEVHHNKISSIRNKSIDETYNDIDFGSDTNSSIIQLESNDKEFELGDEVTFERVMSVVEEIIRDLREPDKTIALQFLFGNIKLKELAQNLGLNENTAKTVTRRAKQTIKDEAIKKDPAIKQWVEDFL